MSIPEEHVVAGAQFGPYRVESLLGEGGMGRVYKARDTRLNRFVAVKFVRREFAERFGREAQAIAQLNHPHICTLHDVGSDYLVMELVDGVTLAARLSHGQLPFDQVLRYGAQIASALAAAHANGIVHRDLKPGNVMLTKLGAKVLDFGLATTNSGQTVTGCDVVVGTPAYMAPEQRQGREVDARTDIYALGLVLREMACGDRLDELQRLPPQFVHIVTRCLELDPADRWQAASDVKKELEWVALAPVTTPSKASSSASRLPWIIALLALTGAIAFAALNVRREPVATLAAQFTLALDDEVSGYDLSTLPVPSPTGDLLVFAGSSVDGGTSLWIRSLRSVETRRLVGTEGAGRVAWSPDGQWIAFFADGKLKKVSPYGGPPQTITTVAGFQDAAWGPDGDIIFRPSNRTPLFRVRDSGGSPEPLTTLNTSLTENSHRFPQFLPGGRQFLFVSRCGERENNALYIGSLDTPEVTRVMETQSRVTYVPPAAGRPEMLVFFRDGALVAQRFNLRNRDRMGEATTLLERIGYNAPSIEARFRVSHDGRVVVAQTGDPSLARLVWYDRNGQEVAELGPTADYSQPRISPDGGRVAFSRSDPQTGNRDVWFIEIARGISSRLTTHVANDWYPVWAPDGRRLLFGSDRAGGPEVWPYLKTSMDPGSSESPHLSVASDPHDWDASGEWIAYVQSRDLHVGRSDGRRPPVAFLSTPADENFPRFSPDGRWLAYTSDESGRFEVYVRPFAGAPAVPTGKLQVSHTGGEYAIWPRGPEMFYLSADGYLFAVDVRNLGKVETLPPPVRLFRICPTTESVLGPGFDTRDGQRFLAVCRIEPPGRFTVLLNWSAPGSE